MRADRSPAVDTGNATLRIIEIDPQTDPRWEGLVTSLPTSLLYQHPLWLQVLEGAYGYQPIHLACEDATGQVHGILPLFYRRGLLTGRSLTSLFQSPVAGPLASDEQARAALVRAAIERTRAEPGTQLHLQVLSNALDGLVDGVSGMPMYETYLLALPERPDLLRLNSRIKWAVNKATRSGVQVRQAQNEQELRAWYELYLQTMRRLAVVPQPYRFFELAWQRLSPHGLLRLLLAEHVETGRRRLLSGFLYLLWGQTISHAFAGWRWEDHALQPNDALHWRAIQDACSEGFRWYDFGDVPRGNQGLARYKSKWGADAKMIYGYCYPMPPDGMSSASDRSRSAVRQLLHAVWRHLPLKAIGLLSDWRHTFHYY